MIPAAYSLVLESLQIRDYRAIEKAHIPLHPRLTMLIGENATGKTTILEAIATALWPLVRRFSSPARPGISVTEFDFRTDNSAGYESEPRRRRELMVKLQSTIGPISSHHMLDEQYADKPSITSDHDQGPMRWLAQLLDTEKTAPILAYYRDNRGQFHGGKDAFVRRPHRGRQAAYLMSFGAKVYFDEAVAWFEEAESAELREQRERGQGFTDYRLAAVRAAVEKLVPEVSDLRMLGRPPQLAMTLTSEAQESRLLTANQLSSGFRTMVALGMDLARRMADLNPHLSDPTQSPGIVLIDEIDLHLHPRWQQLVVDGLLKAFPQVQFIMTTHSPQVLTTLREENILKLNWHDNKLVLEPVPSTEGAEAGRLLLSAMGVSERPPAQVSPFVRALEAYVELLRNGRAETREARELLTKMQSISSDDPVLATLELEKLGWPRVEADSETLFRPDWRSARIS